MAVWSPWRARTEPVHLARTSDRWCVESDVVLVEGVEPCWSLPGDATAVRPPTGRSLRPRPHLRRPPVLTIAHFHVGTIARRVDTHKSGPVMHQGRQPLSAVNPSGAVMGSAPWVWRSAGNRPTCTGGGQTRPLKCTHSGRSRADAHTMRQMRTLRKCKSGRRMPGLYVGHLAPCLTPTESVFSRRLPAWDPAGTTTIRLGVAQFAADAVVECRADVNNEPETQAESRSTKGCPTRPRQVCPPRCPAAHPGRPSGCWRQRTPVANQARSRVEGRGRRGATILRRRCRLCRVPRSMPRGCGGAHSSAGVPRRS